MPPVATRARDPKPDWLKVKLPTGEKYELIKGLLKEQGLNTVCEEARCPNIAECWGGGTATFMILGDTCTRGCRFCSVQSAARLPPPDPAAPAKLAQSLSVLGIDYVVVHSVCQDVLTYHDLCYFTFC